MMHVVTKTSDLEGYFRDMIFGGYNKYFRANNRGWAAGHGRRLRNTESVSKNKGGDYGVS